MNWSCLLSSAVDVVVVVVVNVVVVVLALELLARFSCGTMAFSLKDGTTIADRLFVVRSRPTIGCDGIFQRLSESSGQKCKWGKVSEIC